MNMAIIKKAHDFFYAIFSIVNFGFMKLVKVPEK